MIGQQTGNQIGQQDPTAEDDGQNGDQFRVAKKVPGWPGVEAQAGVFQVNGQTQRVAVP